MRQLIIILVLLTISTGCRYQYFDYETTVVDKPGDYSALLDKIIEESKYENNVVGPHSRFHLIVDYHNGTTTVSGLNKRKTIWALNDI